MGCLKPTATPIGVCWVGCSSSLKELAMTLRSSLYRPVLSSIFLIIAAYVAACVAPMTPDTDVETTQSTSLGVDTATGDASYGRACGRGVKRCSPQQAGQQCNPNDPLFLCVEQTSGAFCCLPVAQ
jgi:hypothetical protein